MPFELPAETLLAYLQIDQATASETTLAAAENACTLAVGLVEGFIAPRSFGEAQEHTEVLRINAGKVVLPGAVETVASVKLVGDNDLRLPTVWSFDGINTVHLGDASVIVNLPEVDTTALHTAEVTWTSSADEAPAEVSAVALAVAARAFGNPRGLRSETIGAYAYTNAGADDDVATLGLLASERLTLGKYRPSGNRTMELRR